MDKQEAISYFLAYAAEQSTLGFTSKGGGEDRDRMMIKYWLSGGELQIDPNRYQGTVNNTILTGGWQDVKAVVDYENCEIQFGQPECIEHGLWYENLFSDGSIFCFKGCDATPILGSVEQNRK